MVKAGKTTIFKERKRIIILGVIVIIAIGIQFYRPHKNVQKEVVVQDFLVHEKAPKNVGTLIKNSCYNCHSNFTDYYWYDQIAPASWYVDGHIKEGKEHLNFSNWSIKDYRDKRAYLSQIASFINENKMPLPSYTLMHPEAILSDKEKQKIIKWLFTIDVQRK